MMVQLGGGERYGKTCPSLGKCSSWTIQCIMRGILVSSQPSWVKYIQKNSKSHCKLRFVPGACLFCGRTGDLLERGFVFGKLCHDADRVNGEEMDREIAAHDLCMVRSVRDLRCLLLSLTEAAYSCSPPVWSKLVMKWNR